jgi:adenylate cyclase, class 2
MLEIEAKFAVDSFADIEKLFVFENLVFQQDVYYQHPNRDFNKTNERLRVRKIDYNGQQEYWLCYKSGNETKSEIRKELDFEVKAKIIDIFKILDIKELVTVEKYRRFTSVGDVTITLDEVVGLGKFVEIEMLVDDTLPNLPSRKKQAISIINKTGKEMGLKTQEKRSYAKMMLEKK